MEYSNIISGTSPLISLLSLAAELLRPGQENKDELSAVPFMHNCISDVALRRWIQRWSYQPLRERKIFRQIEAEVCALPRVQIRSAGLFFLLSNRASG